MNPHHHPNEELLVDFATGALARHARLVIDGHLNACPACRQHVSEAEAAGGALLSLLAPAPMRADALAVALARSERPTPSLPPGAEPESNWIAIGTEVAEAARSRRRWAAPGVWVAPVLGRRGGPRSYLLGVGAGMRVPRHTHRGVEMVCVLEGSFQDGDIIYGAGDFACSDESVEHLPRITADGECVCLIAADAPLVPLDWVGRIFQPIVGI
jgi:putative transcriptional regulator